MLSSIDPQTLVTQLWTRNAPIVLDVRTKDDFAENPIIIPSAKQQIAQSMPEGPGPFVVICHKGLKLSQGLAAWIITTGRTAQYMEGGMCAWVEQNLPTLPAAKHPENNIWVCAQNAPVLAWAVQSAFGRDATVLRVPSPSVADVADRFSATAVHSIPDLLQDTGLHASALGRFIHDLTEKDSTLAHIVNSPNLSDADRNLFLDIALSASIRDGGEK